jgi:hypothetical protein
MPQLPSNAKELSSLASGVNMALKKVAEHEGWEIVVAGPGSFSIRKAGQAIGPYDSVEEAKQAINYEETRTLSPRPVPQER